MKVSLDRWLASAVAVAVAASSLSATAAASYTSEVASPAAPSAAEPPFVAGRIFTGGVIRDVLPPETSVSDVYGCCASTPVLARHDSLDDVESEHRRLLTRVRIGTMPQMTEGQALEALRSAEEAWDGGSGVWPQMSLAQRVKAVRAFLEKLKDRREEIVRVLMYEIGKNRPDAEAEFDRTMEFAERTMAYVGSSDEFGREWDASNGSTRLLLSRAAVGIVLCLG